MAKEFYSFYRPHDPLATAYTGAIENPWTGEITYPPSMTKQSFVEECDINNILADYKMTGQIKHINERASSGIYADLPSALDLQESLNVVIQAEAAFNSLPSQVRARFGNDPQQFLEFLHNPDNGDEAVRLGLATAPAPIASSSGAPAIDKPVQEEPAAQPKA